jgi:acyl-CoA synthetase (AMP-forming)/AMP-acid ligase II/acyl carrier protein
MRRIGSYMDHSFVRSVRTLPELLRQTAFHRPEHIAYRFLTDGGEEVCLAYGELERRVGVIAARLHSFVGQRALLLYPPGLESVIAFWACVCAGVIAVPSYSPPAKVRLKNSSERIQAIMRDADPRIGLTVSSSLGAVKQLLANSPQGHDLPWLATDALEGGAEDRQPEPPVTGHSLAFLQYTSGSTANPKGVMVTHGNLLHNLEMLKCAFLQNENSVIVSWLPFYHDMGLIGGMLLPIYVGATCVLMSPMRFWQRPVSWLEAISTYRATMSGGPDSAYDFCARKVTAEQIVTLDLSCWSAAVNGAEPVRQSTLERFTSAFEPCGFRQDTFRPCYGLAEATLLVAGGRVRNSPMVRTFQSAAFTRGEMVEVSDEGEWGRSLVSCGEIPFNEEVAIVNPETSDEQPPDRVGEILVSGPNVAQGYWNRPAESEQTFRARVARRDGQVFLRTGDLGFLRNRELFITGRIKDLIIVRGRNYYPQDIELTAQNSHPSLRSGCGAAFSIEVNNEERLVVVQEAKVRQRDVETVLDAIRRHVASEHELQPYAVVVIRPGGCRKTSSGKIQRGACRDAFLSGSLAMIGEWRETVICSNGDSSQAGAPLNLESVLAAEAHERKTLLDNLLRQELANILRVSRLLVDIQQPLVDLGIDSVRSFELKNRIERAFGVAIPVTRLLEGASIADLTNLVLHQIGDERAVLSKASTGPDDINGVENAEELLSRIDTLSDEEIAVLLEKVSKNGK